MPETRLKLILPLAAAAVLAAAAAWSQDEAEPPAPVGEGAAGENAAGEESAAAGERADGVTGEAPADAAADEAEAEEEAGPAVGLDEIPELDEQTYEKDDDDFIPTEEIPVDQAIPFPTDI